jgi:hypothetical protein
MTLPINSGTCPIAHAQLSDRGSVAVQPGDLDRIAAELNISLDRSSDSGHPHRPARCVVLTCGTYS